MILEAPASSRWRLARAGELIRANTKRTLTDGQTLSRLRRALLRWAAKRGRHDLPWRQSRDAYRVWISEIMLQQTTVVAVIPYFERFLARFPTLAALAEADEHEVLRLWAGLGYYSRARNLHAAARQIVQEHAGTVPSDVATLTTLPGNRPVYGGSHRVVCLRPPRSDRGGQHTAGLRAADGLAGAARFHDGSKCYLEFCRARGPAKSPGAFNEALMDLGATICVPASPRCDECPVTACCQAFRDGLQGEIPIPRVRPEPTSVRQAMIAVQRGRRYLLRKSPPGERWAGTVGVSAGAGGG